jgi:hypothetical protein
MRSTWLPAVLGLVLALAPSPAAAGVPSVRPVGAPGAYAGFDLETGGETLARVRFSSNDAILAAQVEPLPDLPGGLKFTGLHARPGIPFTLAEGGEVRVQPGPADDPFPELEFHFTLAAFDAPGWERAMGGPCPFHFLTLGLEGAQVIHHRGWLVATPSLDPYPMQVGRQGQVASRWSRNWTWAPPFGACPLPVAGLWAPERGRYAALDFMEARLRDHSEKFLASAYCWKQGASADFIALVAPAAEHYVKLRYPVPPLTVASHCRLLYDLDLHSWDDPNQRYHQRLWRRYADLLPGAPLANDLRWMPGPKRLREWPEPRPIGLRYRVPEQDAWESRFFEPGAVLPTGGPGTAVDGFYQAHRPLRIQELKQQVEYMLGQVKRFQAGGESCCYWEKPLEGRPRLKYAGDVTTLRHTHGWNVADVMLALYEHEPDPRLLEVVDGVLAWSKYNICTRNDISDVPEAMFTMAGGAIRLFLRYHRLFRDDPARAERAALALRLAQTLAYRYLPMFLPDTAEDDAIDGSWLLEPNSARPWLGMACSNECCLVPDSLARVVVATGDPVLLACLRGMVERWPLLTQDRDAAGTATSTVLCTECWGLFDGCEKGGRDKRAPYGGLMGFDLIRPLGDAAARVVCGEQGAVAFAQGAVRTDVADYRASRGLRDGLSFRVDSDRSGAFNLHVTVPDQDLSVPAVLRLRAGKLDRLQAGRDFKRSPFSPWDLLVHGVVNGDVLALGRLDPALPVHDLRPVKGWSVQPRDFAGEGFRVADLARACNWQPGLDWDDNGSYAPCPPGDHYAWGVPYFIVPACLNAQKTALRDGTAGIELRTSALAFFISEAGPGAQVRVRFQDGSTAEVPLARRRLAWKAWPRWFPAHIDAVPFLLPEPRQVVAVEARGLNLWSVTAATSAPGEARIKAWMGDGPTPGEALAMSGAD